MPPRIPIPILRFFASHELPFTRHLLAHAGVWRHEPWRLSQPRSRRGKWHGYRITFDLRDFHQRGAYLYGRLLDLVVQLAVRDTLRPGDTFVDIGANIGILTLHGARRVGPRGVVHAFEPNPEVFQRLEAHVRGNALGNVRLHRIALSDRDGEQALSVPPTGNTGAASLGGLAPRHARPALATYQVTLRRGDGLLAEAPADAPMLLKLDIEGHEPFALRGLARTIESRRPAIITEFNAEMLACHGSGPAELLGLFRDRGYRGYLLGARWHRVLRRWRLRLHPVPPGPWNPARTLNAIFLDPDGVHHTRLRRFLVP